MQPYQPREIEFLRVLEHGEWHVKLYSIAFGVERVHEERFSGGLETALQYLPLPAVNSVRPGAAFCILHQGRGVDYIVLAWWDRENELPLRVLVRAPSDAAWRASRGSESVCVWDLQVIAFERDAYVATVLADPPRPLDHYVSLVLPNPHRSPVPSGRADS